MKAIKYRLQAHWARIKAVVRFLAGRHRIKLGFCPVCNSDAPDVYCCACCDSYQHASGDQFPPSKETKLEWLKNNNMYFSASIKLTNDILSSRLRRINN